MKKKLQIAVIGSSGRMGVAISQKLKRNKNYQLALGISHSKINKEFKISRFEIRKEDFKGIDLILDFSSPEVTLQALKMARLYKTPLISGTTGFSSEQFSKVKSASRQIPIFYSANLSFGILLVRKWIQQKDMRRFFDQVVIKEIHHKKKKDRPSGTAKLLQEDLKKSFSKIPIQSFRQGSEKGFHEIIFKNKYEEIRLSHRALSRDLFSNSMDLIINMIGRKKKGFFDMMSL